MKRTRMLLALLLAVCFCGCDHTAGGAETAPSDTTVSQTLPAASLPAETTLPENATEPAYPPVPVEEVRHIVLTDTMPEYDTKADSSFVLDAAGEENGYFTASYLHVYPNATTAFAPIRGGMVWVCPDPVEYKSGSRYEVFVPENGTLRQLQTTRYSGTAVADGHQFQVIFEYVLYNNRLHLTYKPVYENTDNSVAHYELSLTEDNEKLLLTVYVKTGQDYQPYSGYIDLRTGQIDALVPLQPTPIPNYFNASLLPESYGIEAIYNNESFLLYHGGMGDTPRYYYYLDGEREAVYDLSALSECLFKSCYQMDSRLILQTQAGSGGTAYDFWAFDLEKKSFECILQDVWAGDYTGQSTVIYRDLDGINHIYNLRADKDWAIPDFGYRMGNNGDYALYKTKDGQTIFYDVLSDRFVRLQVPDAWEILGGSLSPNGRWFFIGNRIAGTVQVLLYDLEKDIVLEIRRTNPNVVVENLTYWTDDNALVFSSDDSRELYQYRFIS